MKTRSVLTLVGVVALLAFGALTAFAQSTPVTTAFTYQGSLLNGADPASGVYDFKFTLYDRLAGGAVVGAPIARDNLSVLGGVFTVPLDFGPVFTGTQRFLEIAVRADGNGAYTTLSPRQPLSAVPYALYALNSPPGE